MGIFDKLFGKKPSLQNQTLPTAKSEIVPYKQSFTVHEDLKNLLWIADGPMQNYLPQNRDRIYEYGGFRITFPSFSLQEPSLISMRLPIQEDVDSKQIERPPYYPTYSGLTDAQRGVYWKLLANPYSGKFDIGFVFILYYGLERHLLEGRFEDAFHVILKLRDVYDNGSFQSYSACALILTCLFRQRPDLAIEFYNSLNKDHEFVFPDNLYLLCKMGLNIPLTVNDIMRMSKTFEFNNQNYIKKYPEMFLTKLSAAMQNNLGSSELEINKFVTQTEWRRLHKQTVPIFANVSIYDKSIDVPLISESFKLKKAAYDLLEQSHEAVKVELAQMRKKGVAPTEKAPKRTKIIVPLLFDNTLEKELIQQYKSTHTNAKDRHFALIGLQDFYYKYRELDNNYLQTCIDYCNEDIALLPKIQMQHVRESQESLAFMGTIPAFKRLAIIYEKSKDYAKGITICNNAISYYTDIGMFDDIIDFEQRKQKLQAKVK